MPGLAIVTAALLAPAALALTRVREWVTPALAPLLGLIGAAPAFLAIAARHERNGGRAALAALAWAWTGIAGAVMGETLGVSAAGIDSSGWVSSGPVTMDSVLGSLLTPTAISIGLIWVGGTVLLGLLLDATGPAGAAVGGLIWSAMIVASLGAAGADAVPSILLTPALVIAVGIAIWDRHGRPDLRRMAAGIGGGRAHCDRDQTAPSRRTAPGGHAPTAQSSRLTSRRRGDPSDPNCEKARASSSPRGRFAGRVAVGLGPSIACRAGSERRATTNLP